MHDTHTQVPAAKMYVESAAREYNTLALAGRLSHLYIYVDMRSFRLFPVFSEFQEESSWRGKIYWPADFRV